MNEQYSRLHMYHGRSAKKYRKIGHGKAVCGDKDRQTKLVM